MWNKSPCIFVFLLAWVVGATTISSNDVGVVSPTGGFWYSSGDQCCDDRGWLGVSFRGLNEDEQGATGGKGIIVLHVVEDSPADEVGLKKGDIVFSLNGEEIDDTDAFILLMKAHRPGDSITLEVRRDDEAFTVGPVLSERPERVTYRFIGFGKKGYLGVSLIDLTPELREFYGVSGYAGVLVGKVAEESPAEEAGFKVGDIITEIDGDEVASSHDIQKIVRGKDEGEDVEVTVSRKGRTRTLTPVIVEKEIKHLNLGKMGASPMSIHIPEIEIPDIEVELEKLEELEPIVLRSVARLQKIVESKEFQEQLKEFQSLEKELQLKIRALEERLRELEDQLRRSEEDGDSHR